MDKLDHMPIYIEKTYFPFFHLAMAPGPAKPAKKHCLFSSEQLGNAIAAVIDEKWRVATAV